MKQFNYILSKTSKFFNKLTLFEKILLSLNFITYTVFLFINLNILGFVAWLSCTIYIFAQLYHANGKWYGFIFSIISYAIYIYFCVVSNYYGELFTSIIVIVSNFIVMIEWLRHKKITDNEERVEIKKLKIKEIIIVFGIFIGLSVGLYYLLESFGTDLLILNTIILSFSFLNTYFSYRRSIFQYFCYVVEEAIYITLWFASWIKGNGGADIFAICGIFSFAWGIYSFINWIKIYKKQINS